MLKLKWIVYDDYIKKLVKKYKLTKQFEKAIFYIQNWNFKEVDFKLRQPKSKGIWYFRINKQYRAWCRIIDDILFIIDIDDHSKG
jgi:plasmid maintenance system killer protein